MKDIFAHDIAVKANGKKPKYGIYWVGQPDAHIMDWAGGNYRRARYPQRYFDTYAEAVAEANRIEAADRAAHDFFNKKWESRPDHTVEQNQEYRRHLMNLLNHLIEGDGTHISDGYQADQVFEERTVDHELTEDEFLLLKWHVRNVRAGRDSWDEGTGACEKQIPQIIEEERKR